MAFGLPQALVGRKDRKVWLLRATQTTNDLNEPVETFVRARSMWAEVKHLSVAEKYEADSTRAMKRTLFRVQYSPDINETDRIEHDNQIYKVMGITELGRREMTEVFAEMVESMAP